MKAKTKEDLINDLYYEVFVITPIKGIITNLKEKNYTSNDLPFLNKKLVEFGKLALQMTGRSNFIMPEEVVSNSYYYNFQITRFRNYFERLLKFFEEYFEE